MIGTLAALAGLGQLHMQLYYNRFSRAADVGLRPEYTKVFDIALAGEGKLTARLRGGLARPTGAVRASPSTYFTSQIGQQHIALTYETREGTRVDIFDTDRLRKRRTYLFKGTALSISFSPSGSYLLVRRLDFANNKGAQRLATLVGVRQTFKVELGVAAAAIWASNKDAVYISKNPPSELGEWESYVCDRKKTQLAKWENVLTGTPLGDMFRLGMQWRAESISRDFVLRSAGLAGSVSFPPRRLNDAPTLLWQRHIVKLPKPREGELAAYAQMIDTRNAAAIYLAQGHGAREQSGTLLHITTLELPGDKAHNYTVPWQGGGDPDLESFWLGSAPNP